MAGSVRSPLAFWMGGASAPSVTVQAGFRSMMALWAGGATAGADVIPPEVIPPQSRPYRYWHAGVAFDVDEEDEELLVILTAVAPMLNRSTF